MSDIQAMGLTDAEKAEILKMEWTGEYYTPPLRFRLPLARLGLLDPHFGYAVTTKGEAVRALLEKNNG